MSFGNLLGVEERTCTHVCKPIYVPTHSREQALKEAYSFTVNPIAAVSRSEGNSEGSSKAS